MLASSRTQLLASGGMIIMLSVIAVLVATWFGAATERMLTVFFISLTAVVGIGVYSGNSGILSFGHVAFMGIGAYASSLLTVPAALKVATLPSLPNWLAVVEHTVLPRSGLNPCGTDPSFALRTQNRLLKHLTSLGRFKTRHQHTSTFIKELDPF